MWEFTAVDIVSSRVIADRTQVFWEYARFGKTPMITEHIDNMKTRSILFILLLIAIFILAVILLKSSICTFPRLIILDFLSLAILIGLMGTFWKGVSEIGEL